MKFLFLILLSSCVINERAVIKANEVCASNGGLEQVWIDVQVYKALCKNGAVFKGLQKL